MESQAAEIARLQNRVLELEELCGLPHRRAPNPFTGSHRVRMMIIAKLLLAREQVSKTAIALAIGGEDFSEHTPAVYISFLRKQLPRGIVKTEWGVGWFISPADKPKLRAFLQEAGQ